MVRLKMPEGEAIEHPLVSRSLESAQRKVEQRNFDIRKQLLEYDDVSNDQRKVIYQQRNELLDSEDIAETITAMRQGQIHDTLPPAHPGRKRRGAVGYPAWSRRWRRNCTSSSRLANGSRPSRSRRRRDPQAPARCRRCRLCRKDGQCRSAAWAGFERNVMLQSLDTHWREHLSALDHLRQGIHLRGYAQKNPKQEYKREAFELFEGLLQTVRSEVTKLLMTVEVRSEEQIEEAETPPNWRTCSTTTPTTTRRWRPPPSPRRRNPWSVIRPRSGATIPVPAAAGKKYKHCHGKLS
jgi:preprotein translocase subunit SecA